MVAARACCWTLELPAAAAGCHPVVKNRIKKAEKNNKRRDTQTSNYYTTAQQISLRELGPFVLCVCRWCSPASISNMRFFFCFVLILFRRWIEESRVLSYPLCVLSMYICMSASVLSVRIKWGPSASSLICFLFCFFFPCIRNELKCRGFENN